MKNFTYLTLAFLFFMIITGCSLGKGKNTNTNRYDHIDNTNKKDDAVFDKDHNIQTTFFTLDLSEPTNRSLQITGGFLKKRLVAKSKTPIAFNLKNVNPLKYKYVINHEYVSFFKDDMSAFKMSQDKDKIDSLANQIPSDNVNKTKIQPDLSNAKSIIEGVGNKELANKLLIKYIKPTSKDVEFTNIKNALRILQFKIDTLSTNIDNEINKLSGEDFLVKKDVETYRNNAGKAYSTYLTNP